MAACYRHATAETGIQCQRCGRNICPECMNPAAVGFHCPECVAQAVSRRPVQRTAVGARRRSSVPTLTYSLIGLCALIYLGQIALPRFSGLNLTQLMAYAPIFTSSWIGDSQPWRMLTSALVHSPQNAAHLLFNMLALWFTGRVLEPELGRLRYGAVLLLSAFGGSVAVLFLSDPLTPTVGASGAVFGLFGALLVILRSVRSSQTPGLVVLIAVNLLMGFFVPNISWQGHIGGLVIGALCALILTLIPRGPRRGLWQGLGLMGVAVTLIVLTVIGAQWVHLGI